MMIKPLAIAILVVAGTVGSETMANATWAVWKQHVSQPGEVSVAPLGSLDGPWRVDSVWNSDWKGAWKKACWLVRNGDITGRRYTAPDMNTEKVTCDANCNCRPWRSSTTH